MNNCNFNHSFAYIHNTYLSATLASNLINKFTQNGASTALQLFQLARYSTYVLIGIFLVKMNVSQAQIAWYETFIMISGMAGYFWIGGIINTVIVEHSKAYEESKSKIYFSAFILLLFCGLLAATFILLLSWWNVEPLGTFKPISLLTLFVFINGAGYLAEYILFIEKKTPQLILLAFINSSLLITAVLISIFTHFESNHPVNFIAAFREFNDSFPNTILFNFCVVASIKVIVLLILIKQYASFDFDLQLTKNLAKVALPIAATLVISGSSEYIDGMIVNRKFSPSAFTVFRYGAKELPVLLIIANTFSSTMLGIVAANLTNGAIQIRERSLRLMHMFFPATFLLMLFSPFIFTEVFSSGFIFSALIFNFYLLLIIPRLVFPQTILTGLGQTQFPLISSILEAAINVTASIYLCSKMGIMGVAAGTFIAFSADKIFLSSVLHFRYKMSPKAYIPLNWYLFYSVLTVACFVVSYLISFEI